MTDILFPPYLRVSAQRVAAVSNSEIARSIFTGAATGVQRAGDRLAFAISTQNASNRAMVAERAKLASLRTRLRGMANRLWYSPVGYSPRGSFPASEVLTNNTFTSTSGWQSGSFFSHTANDNVLRATVIKASASGTTAFAPSSALTLTPYFPYVARVMTRAGRGTFSLRLEAGTGATSSAYESGTGTAPSALLTTKFVPYQASSYINVDPNLSNDLLADDYFDITWASLSRCALVDNGVNLLTYSDQFDNAVWTKTRSSVSANATNAPDGTTTADAIIEDSTASSTHLVAESFTASSSSSIDYAFSVALKANTRTWAVIRIWDSTANASVAIAYVNLSTGALGSVSSSAPGLNPRAYVSSMGDGWYCVSIVGRKVVADTSLAARIGLATGDGGETYSGDGVSSIYAWRGTMAQSSVPVRLTQTTTTASSGTSQTGASLYLRGLPVSTNGLLLEGDYVQIGSQLVPVAASLNSDGLGLGYLQLAWPLRTAPADSDPVIANTPMGRFVLTGNAGGWDERPGIVADFDFELEEDLTT